MYGVSFNDLNEYVIYTTVHRYIFLYCFYLFKLHKSSVGLDILPKLILYPIFSNAVKDLVCKDCSK